jgi:enterochelin esterase-like enzyme
MHDGQMLFDSTQTWNKKEWLADEIFSKLITENKIESCIIVAIWNTPERITEYFPNKIFENLEPDLQKSILEKYGNGKKISSDNYLKFIVSELKPFIDKKYSTYTDKEHTVIMGSSMGGLISVYAISEYPGIFGSAACLSTAWFSFVEPNYAIPVAVFEYLKKNFPSPMDHKIYMDYGTGESDKPYELTQSFVDIIAKGKGYGEGNYKSMVFDKAVHDEIAWSSRLNKPMEFLLPAIQPQKPVAGKIDFYKNFQSEYMGERNIEVWLPEGFSDKKKYDVLYMHDGQMLFDSINAWNHQSWDVYDVATRLMNEGKTKDFIVVGIWNGGKSRHANYFPQKPFDEMTAEQKAQVIKELQTIGNTNEVFQPNSDNYLKFLVKELKPFIDKTYPVFTNAKHTFVSGSSMGGLISMYAICEYPEVFGGAACLSTHWPGTFSVENNPVPEAFLNYLKNNLPDPKTHRLYFDCGDQSIDSLYPPIQKKVDEVMKSKGYTFKNWKTKYFPGKDHSEKAWNERLDVPLLFLLNK